MDLRQIMDKARADLDAVDLVDLCPVTAGAVKRGKLIDIVYRAVFAAAQMTDEEKKAGLLDERTT